MLDRVEEFAPAKVNLALHVLGRRTDGYHELDSIVAFAGVGDTLILRPSAATSLSIDGPEAENLSAEADNLVLRAHALLATHVPLPPVQFHLTKRLPIASGIGGGSADAAAALRGLLRLTAQTLPPPALNALALKLGADVPVCLFGSTCRMQGVGEVITPLRAGLGNTILLVNPRAPCSTASVFKTMAIAAGQSFGTALDPQDPATWRNDMTDAAVTVQPLIADVLATLNETCKGATVRMSGSGATCFALFSSTDDAHAAAATLRQSHPHWWIETAALQ